MLDRRLHHCLQLITIKKTTNTHYPSPYNSAGGDAVSDCDRNENGHVPTHKDFREKYFKGFRRDSDEDQPVNLQRGPASEQKNANEED